MQHIESMGDKLFPLGIMENDIHGVIATIIEEGGTRPAWGNSDGELERILMAWPQESLLRVSTIMAGKPDGQLTAVTLSPLMEGEPNLLKVFDMYPWKDGHAGEIAAHPNGLPPLWFYDPVYFRDAAGLEKGQLVYFNLSGLCYGMRRALLDDLTITQGPIYEQHALAWMKENPDKTRLDVPPFKVSLRGKSFVDATEHCCEYQCRAPISEVESFMFGPEEAQIKIYCFAIEFGPENEDAQKVKVRLYAPEVVLAKGFVPKDGDEVDMIFWLQGRIEDSEMGAENVQ